MSSHDRRRSQFSSGLVTPQIHSHGPELMADPLPSSNFQQHKSFICDMNCTSCNALLSFKTDDVACRVTESTSHQSNQTKSQSSLSVSELDQQVQYLTKLTELVNGHPSIQHPICLVCAQHAQTELDRRLKEVDNQKQLYESCLAELSDAGVSSAGDPTCSLSDEAELLNELETLKAERLSLRSEHERLVSEISNLDEAELRLFEEYHKFSIDLDHLSGEHLSLQNSLLASTDRLERLKRVNVFDDTFHISTDGHFGTINGFRLGTLPGSQPVEWNEINAALGHSCLLLATLAKRCSFKFSKFKLIPLGSYSKMAKLDDPTTMFELHCSELSLGRIFWHRRFHTAMEYFLQCIKEFSEWAESQDSTFRLKYRIVEDKINNLSIKLSFRQEEVWTEALSFMLRALKQLLAWCAKHVLSDK